MIRNIIVPRVLGKTQEDLRPALELLRALGASPGHEWHEGDAHGFQLEAPAGAVEVIAAASRPATDVKVEVSDAEAAWEIVKHHGTKVLHEIGDTAYGARIFVIELNGVRMAVVAYGRKARGGQEVEGSLQAEGRRFAIVVARFNSFITGRLLEGAMLALRQSGVAKHDITIVRVPGSFEIPSAARQLAETSNYDAIANEVTRGLGQSAQETGVPHAFGVLTCDTLEQAIDRAGLKSGNKGYEAALAAVEMASLRHKVAEHTTGKP